VPQPSSNVHSSFVVPNVGSLCVACNHVRTVRYLLRQSRMRGRSNGSITILHVEGHIVHDLVDMPNENPHNVNDTPHEIHMTNVSTIPNCDTPHQMYVPRASPAMIRRRSNRLNGVGLDVQYHDNYDMDILRKIVKIFTRDLPELEYVNSSMRKLVHVYGVVVSNFWNAEDEVHMLSIQFFW
jgi:hypothetical protein